MLTGFYGAYILMAGLPRLMKSPPEKTLNFAAVVVIGAFALTMFAIDAQGALFGTPL